MNSRTIWERVSPSDFATLSILGGRFAVQRDAQLLEPLDGAGRFLAAHESDRRMAFPINSGIWGTTAFPQAPTRSNQSGNP